jgi:hypothetical protein
MASSATPPHDSIIKLANPGPPAHVIKWYLNDEVIQKKLLDEPKLTYKRAIELAESAEAAARGQKEMRTPAKTEPEHRVASKSEGTDKESKGMVCHRCGKPGHLATVCRFKDKICHNCKTHR